MTESVRPLIERLREATDQLVITQRAWDQTLGSNSLRQAQQNTINVMREAADALVSAEARITALEESVIAAMSALGSGNCTVNVCEGCKADEDMAYRELREAIGDKLPAELKTFARGGKTGAQRAVVPHRTSGDS